MEETGSLVNQEKTKTMDSNRYRQLQLKFLQAHLNEWFPQLNQSIQANAKNPFYRSLALITEAFLAQDTASLSGQPDSERHMECRPKEPQ
jgi:TorA maturation chaperone TorD